MVLDALFSHEIMAQRFSATQNISSVIQIRIFWNKHHQPNLNTLIVMHVVGGLKTNVCTNHKVWLNDRKHYG